MTTPSGTERIGGRRVAALGTVIVLALVGGSLAAYQVLDPRLAPGDGASTSLGAPLFV